MQLPLIPSVMAEDAEEAAKKLDRKEFFGNVIHVEVAKPKKRGMFQRSNLGIEKTEDKQQKETEKPVISEEKKEEKLSRVRTIVVFGINPHMSYDTLFQKWRW